MTSASVANVAHVRDLERLAGAVLCVGFPGDAPQEAVLAELAALRPGGVALFGRNVTDPERTRSLVGAVREACGDPYVAVDQEGGRVARLHDGAVDLPSMMALGATGDLALAERAGRVLARDLAAFDIDLDFAPVVDLASDPRASVVGTRSFGDDPQRAAAFAAAVVRGLRAGGAGATLKHFPGHGATSLDSHVALPTVDASLEVLRAREFAAFARALEAEPDAIMTAHVVVRALDPEVPATLSARALEGLLREELGFAGACFSDCLEMGAIAKDAAESAERGLLALAAGCDVLTVSHTLATARAIRDRIVAAVEGGTLPRARLETAARRVATLRETLRARRVRMRDLREARADDALARSRAVALEIARRAVTVVRGDPRVESAAPVTIVSFEAATEDGIAGVRRAYASLNLALRTRGIRSELLRAPLRPASDAIEHLIEVVAMQGRRRVVAIARRARAFEEQARAIDALAARFPDLLLVLAAEPFDATRFPTVANVTCTYGDTETAFEGLADVMSARAPATGVLPVDLAAGIAPAERA